MLNDVVVYDACVLYPAPLRDLLMHLALIDLYHAKWTSEIHEEWIRNLLLRRQDLSREFLEKTRDRMNEHVRDCLVVNYESLLPSLPELPDPGDAHVLAAAIHANASVILTYNLKDFPKSILSVYGIEAQSPDYFLSNLFDFSPELVFMAIQRHRASLKNPPKSAEEYLLTLEIYSLNEFIVKLRECSNRF